MWLTDYQYNKVKELARKTRQPFPDLLSRWIQMMIEQAERG